MCQAGVRKGTILRSDVGCFEFTAKLRLSKIGA